MHAHSNATDIDARMDSAEHAIDIQGAMIAVNMAIMIACASVHLVSRVWHKLRGNSTRRLVTPTEQL